MIVGEDQLWGKRALEFVDAVERLDAPALISRFESLIASCGFTAYIMAGLPSRNAKLPELTLANGWPRDWFDLYVSENFSAVDPVPRHGATTVHPFVWSEAPYDRDRDPAAHRVMTRAAEFGLVVVQRSAWPARTQTSAPRPAARCSSSASMPTAAFVRSAGRSRRAATD